MDAENSGTIIPAAVLEQFESFLQGLAKQELNIEMVSVVMKGIYLPYREENGVPVPLVYHDQGTTKIKGMLTVYPLKESKQENKDSNDPEVNQA